MYQSSPSRCAWQDLGARFSARLRAAVAPLQRELDAIASTLSGAGTTLGRCRALVEAAEAAPPAPEERTFAKEEAGPQGVVDPRQDASFPCPASGCAAKVVGRCRSRRREPRSWFLHHGDTVDWLPRFGAGPTGGSCHFAKVAAHWHQALRRNRLGGCAHQRQ